MFLEIKEIGERLLSIKPGSRRTAEYVIEFCTLAASSGKNEPALKATFYRGSNANVLTELASWYEKSCWNSLNDLAIYVSIDWSI